MAALGWIVAAMLMTENAIDAETHAMVALNAIGTFAGFVNALRMATQDQ